MKPRVAIYARYSSDLQKKSSIEDQLRICRERAVHEGWDVINCYTDPAITGSTFMMRPGIRMLMQDAEAGAFDIVLTEALDRLSRDQADMAVMYKRLSFYGIQIVTLSEGDVGLIDVGLRGVMNQLYIIEMAKKVKRGQRGRVEAGKITAGLAYGYDVVKMFDARGEPIRGERKINPEQAAVVLRIFSDYAAGKSPKAIASQLNKEGVRSPAGKGWNQSSINGRREAGYGILNNHIYAGEIVWNRVSERHCPDTGRVLRRLNPKEDWVINQAPEMRIVPQEIWDAVKKKQANLSHGGSGKFWDAQRPRYLLSGLLKCGDCGGSYSRKGNNRYGCSTFTNKGTCQNRLLVKHETLEASVLNALQHYLMNQEALSIFCEEYTQHVNRMRMERNANIAGYEAQLVRFEKERKKLVEAILRGIPGDQLKDDFIDLGMRKKDVEARLAETEEAPVLLHPRMANHYSDTVTRLISSLDSEGLKAESQELLRTMIDKITLVPNEHRTELQIDLHGDLAGILKIAENSTKSMTQMAHGALKVKMVGPEGLEPPTKPL